METIESLGHDSIGLSRRPQIVAHLVRPGRLHHSLTSQLDSGRRDGIDFGFGHARHPFLQVPSPG
jgi:hypothetical protein